MVTTPPPPLKLMCSSPSDTRMQAASYALGYNLAIEYLADYEKTWMLDSFRDLDRRILSDLGKKVDWIFLEVHAEGEAVRWPTLASCKTEARRSMRFPQGFQKYRCQQLAKEDAAW